MPRARLGVLHAQAKARCSWSCTASGGKGRRCLKSRPRETGRRNLHSWDALWEGTRPLTMSGGGLLPGEYKETITVLHSWANGAWLGWEHLLMQQQGWGCMECKDMGWPEWQSQWTVGCWLQPSHLWHLRPGVDSGQRLLQRDWNEKGPRLAGRVWWGRETHSGDGKVAAPLPWCDLMTRVGRQIKWLLLFFY